jgi:hypothetical protein
MAGFMRDFLSAAVGCGHGLAADRPIATITLHNSGAGLMELAEVKNREGLL